MANLITLQDYKTAEGITQPKDDSRLNVLIPSVSALVKTYCGNSFVDFYSTNKTETFTIDWATHIVQLTESPVNSIVSVKERTSYSDSYNTLTTGAYEYALDTATESILKDEHKQRQTIAGASLQNQGSTSQNNNVSFPDHIKRVLDLYKNF